MTAYRGQIASLINGYDYRLFISDSFSNSYPTVTDDFEIERGSVTMSWLGDDQNIFTTLIPSSLRFTFIAEESGQETALNSVISSGTSTWYVLLFKDGILHWWGYLSAETMSLNREYKPRYNFEAFDKLTLTGTHGIWDFTGPTSDTSSVFGMGWRENGSASGRQIPQALYTPDPYITRDSSLLGIVYSCLFDTDQENIGNQDLNVVQWDVNLDTETPGFKQDINEWLYLAVDENFFEDPANAKYLGAYTTAAHRDWKIADILHECALMHRARIFQRNGEFYFIQWEAYQGDTSSGNMRIHTFDNTQQTPATSYPAEILFPIYQSSSSLSASEYKVNLTTYPRTDPELEPGTNWEYIRGVDTSLLRAKNDAGTDVYNEYERRVNWTGTAFVWTGYSDANRNKSTTQTEWPWGHWKKIKYNSSGVAQGLSNKIYRYAGGTFYKKLLPEHLADALIDYQNGTRRNLHIRLRGDYDILQAITLDSRTYLPVTVVSNLEFESHDISAVEFSHSTANLSDLKKNADVNPNPGGGIGSTPVSVKFDPKLTNDPGGGVGGL